VPTHTYGSAGTHDVTLTVTDNDANTSVLTKKVTSSDTGLVARFRTKKDEASNLKIWFNGEYSHDAAGADVATLHWDFGDGTYYDEGEPWGGDYGWLLVDNASRLIDWTYCGIPGGIPTRTTIYTTLSAGATASQINTAIANCPNGQVVYLNAGTYSVSGTITFGSKNGVTLRGAGAGITIINSSVAGEILNTDAIGFSDGSAISSGYGKGSTSMVVASSSGFAIGSMMLVTQNDDITLVMATGGPAQNYQTTHRVTGIAGNTISFTPPLPYGLTAGLSPIAKYAWTPGASLCGVESLSLRSTNASGADTIVGYWSADRCWLKDVELYNSSNIFIFVYWGLQCEFRRLYNHYTHDFPSNGEGYGAYLYSASTYNLIEDSVFTQHFMGVMENGSSANAILYNYFWNMGAFDLGWILPGVNTSHGAHPMMSLVEGNMMPQLQADGYHGSSSHISIFRNQIHGLDPTKTDNRKMLDLCRANYYFNIVGNILGAASWNPVAYEQVGSQEGVIYRLGYPNMGNDDYVAAVPWPSLYGLTYPDAKVKSTLLRHGNYDYFNDATVWDSGITSHSIPASLFYSAKPSYFGTHQWPPIGPDVTGLVTNIPAKTRWNAFVISGNMADLF